MVPEASMSVVLPFAGIDIEFDDASTELGLVYIASNDNAAYLGEASEQDIAAQIAASRGPSGSNRDYLNELAQALRQLGKEDVHVFAIERYLAKL